MSENFPQRKKVRNASQVAVNAAVGQFST